MHSLRVDHAWHEFVLFTHEYSDFCHRFFGRYMHHSPSNAPETEGDRARRTAHFGEFHAFYETCFDEALPEIWKDHRSINSTRRIINDGAGRLFVRIRDEKAELCDMLHDVPLVILCVDAWAEPAMRFVAETGAFYVRELPGDLADDERVEVIASLVEVGTLRVAS
jgi:hypothetical protein